MTIRIVVTGGTFDKEYDELRGTLDFRTTHVPEMLRLGRSLLDVTVHTLLMIDSLDMSDDERARIVAYCAACAESQIVITHGTDTMVETAIAIATAAQDHAAAAAGATAHDSGVATLRDRTIVLTGAMVPYAFGSSDGLFNLGSALSFVQVLPPGVYVAMNGRWFAWNNVRKNRDAGVFEALQP